MHTGLDLAVLFVAAIGAARWFLRRTVTAKAQDLYELAVAELDTAHSTSLRPALTMRVEGWLERAAAGQLEREGRASFDAPANLLRIAVDRTPIELRGIFEPPRNPFGTSSY